jgi:hypothetical protein
MIPIKVELFEKLGKESFLTSYVRITANDFEDFLAQLEILKRDMRETEESTRKQDLRIEWSYA